MIALLSSSFVVLILFVLIVLFLHFVPLGLLGVRSCRRGQCGNLYPCWDAAAPCCALKDCPTPGEG